MPETTNPFERECSNPDCANGWITTRECGPIVIGRTLDIGTLDRPGPDLRVIRVRCEVCNAE